MSDTIPSPHKVRALRVPADGSAPHVLTLETLMIEPDPIPESMSYRGLLAWLQEEETRHVPNLVVFWGSRGWKSRQYYRIEYECKGCPKLEGFYYVFRTLESDGLQVNPHLSNHGEELYGDVFVFKAAEQAWRAEEDIDGLMDYLGEHRHQWLYPDYVDVDDDILLCDIERAFAEMLLLWKNDELAVQMDTDQEVS